MNLRILIEGILYAVCWSTLSGAEIGSSPRSELMLGVHVSAIDSVLSSHLDLAPGIGLLVEYVDSGSPAEKYGIQKYDVLTHFEDQILIHPNQLGSLIERSVADKDLQIGFIRQGKSEKVIVQLAAQEPELRHAMVDYSDFRSTDDSLTPGQVSQKRTLSVSTVDAEGSVRIILNGGTRWVSIRDNQGQEVFEGYLESDIDRSRLSDEFEASLDLIQSLEKMIASGVVK